MEAAQPAEFIPAIASEAMTLCEMMDRGTYHRLGWIPPATLSVTGWRDTGTAILAMERATCWCWADWWLARGTNALPDDWSGPDARTLQNYSVTARRYPISRRREYVSFKHHAELTALPDCEQDALLDWCTATRPSVAELRAERRRRAGVELPLPKPPRVQPPRSSPKTAPPEVLPPPSPPVEIEAAVQLSLPADLHARAITAAAAAGRSLARWIIALIETELVQ
jgi:hypothetical protein